MEITRFEGATREGEGAMGDFFKVSPSSAECSVRGAIQGPPPLLLGRLASVVLMYNSGSWRKVSVTTNFAGSVTVELTCTETGYVADVQSREFIAKPLVVITGFDGDTGAGTMTDSFEVSPPTASCLPYRDSGVSASMSLTGSGRSRSVSVTADTAGRVTVVLRCTKTGYVTASVPAVFIAQSRVVISEVVGGTRSGDTMTGSFRVWPSTAACSAPRPTGVTTPVSFPDDSGSSRTVSVTTTAPGPVTVALRCTKTGYVTDTASMAFTAPPAPPEVCENPLTLGSDSTAVGGSLAESTTNPCLSNQDGNAQDPYYAKRYNFTLDADSTVDATVATETRLILYLTSTAGVLQTVTSEPYRFTAELAAGSYTIEITTAAARQTGNFELTVSAAAAECPSGQVRMSEYATNTDNGCRPEHCTGTNLIRHYATGQCREVLPGQTVYSFTEAIFDGVRSAANRIIDGRGQNDPCITGGSITANTLAALMLAIPFREIRDNPSLMTLSRWDHWNRYKLKSDGTRDYYNRPLYSRGERYAEPRAHWNPGVGPWQLDSWSKVSQLNHAQRVNIDTVGPIIAEYLGDALCGSNYIGSLGIWVGCNPETAEDMNKCDVTFQDMYDSSEDTLFVRRVDGSSVDGGGLEKRRCRWGNAADFNCYWFDITQAEGYADVLWPDGWKQDSVWLSGTRTEADGPHPNRTPLAAPFVSFTDPADSRRYAVFPGYDTTLIRGVAAGESARKSTLGPESNGWFVGTVDGRALEIKTCSAPGSCTWDEV